MIRVLFDAHQLGRRQTGNETYVRELLGRLPAEPGLSMIAGVERGWSAREAGMTGIRLRRVPRSGLGRLGALAILSRQERADVVHAIYYMPPLTGRPTVVTIHDISYEFFPEFFSRTALARNRLLIRASAMAASCVVTVSETSRRDIVDRYGLPESRVVVIPNGVSPIFHPAERWEPYKGNRPLRVLAVGTLEPRKNLTRLIDALRLLTPEINLSLRIVGPDGYQSAHIRDRVSGAMQTDIVGWATERELAHEYRTADIFVYPSIYEGFGLPLLEAMASGTPVVGSTGGSIPEVAGGAALLVNPYQVEDLAIAIRRIAGDASLAAQLRLRGLERAAKFTWEASAGAHAAVYRSLAS